MDHGQNLVVGLVERRPDEVVHAGIRDYESLSPIALHVENPGQQSTRLGDQETARLNQQTYLQTLEGASIAAAYFSTLAAGESPPPW